MSWLRMDAEILVSCEAAMSAVAILEAETGVPLAERDSSEPISRRTCCGGPMERGDVYTRITYSSLGFAEPGEDVRSRRRFAAVSGH